MTTIRLSAYLYISPTADLISECLIDLLNHFTQTVAKCPQNLSVKSAKNIWANNIFGWHCRLYGTITQKILFAI